MEPYIKYILLAVFPVIILSGCKDRKGKSTASETAISAPIASAAPVKPADLSRLHPVWTQIQGQQLQFNEMLAKMKVRGHYDGQTQSFNTEMRWQKGQQIWMSFTLFGIEGMRVVITPDSLKVIDRLNKRYFLKPFNFINEKTFMNINYADMENLLLGEMVLSNPLASQVLEGDGHLTVMAQGNGMVNQSRFSNNPLNLLEQRVEFPAVMRNLLATFSKYRPLENTNFAYERYLRANDGAKEFWAEVSFNDVSLNRKLTYPFEINKNYIRID